MARRTVRIEVPINKPDAFSKLLNKILKQHETLGKDSPLENNPKIDMKKFKESLTTADQKRAASEKLKGQSEDTMQEAKTIYGNGKGQDVETPGTLYNMEDEVKDILLHENKGNEEELSQWGYNVVVGSAKSPKPRQKKG
ncbi:MAG: hypothetical protein HY841_12520 [Bacteroidetes bacterium]|nr:hypothetical protein [Bacteroidota bacterium]